MSFENSIRPLKEYDYNLLLELDKKDVRRLKTLQPFSIKSANLLESKRGLRIPIMCVQNEVVSPKRGCEGMMS